MTTGTVEQPAAPMSLRDHIAAEEPAKASAAAAPVVVKVETPAVVDEPIDPELQQEIDTVEAPQAEETPADKRARTLKNRASAEKAIKTRLANQRDEARRERDELRQKLQTQPPPAAAQPATPQPARAARPVYDGTHPDDPEPTLESFGDNPDPLVEWTKARTDWAARRVVRQDRHASRQASEAASMEQSRLTALRAFDTHANDLRTTEPTFDAAIANLDLSGPMQAVIFGSGALGPHLALHLAKDPAEHARILALPPAAQFVELGIAKATVIAARKASTAPQPVTQVPAPPSQTVGGHAPAAELDTRKGVPLKDHIRIEEAELAERRARGLRY